jgi:hypothetical protein
MARREIFFVTGARRFRMRQEDQQIHGKDHRLTAVAPGHAHQRVDARLRRAMARAPE